jgi:hypothetical protein
LHLDETIGGSADTLVEFFVGFLQWIGETRKRREKAAKEEKDKKERGGEEGFHGRSLKRIRGQRF